jgi:hypothetical protein
MPYWRMQLHPSDPAAAMRYAVESVAAGFIGLDFAADVGDLRLTERGQLPANQSDYWDFAHRMSVGDRVLLIVHHFPFALVTIAGDYNYIRKPEPELAVWFRHFRRIDRAQTQYYADRVTNARKWEQYTMTDTISVLHTATGKSFQLIQEWSGDIASEAQ